ncbi:MAG: hypothetical protein ACYDCJ_11860 [Gammaproteobacteria bacterium]
MQDLPLANAANSIKTGAAHTSAPSIAPPQAQSVFCAGWCVFARDDILKNHKVKPASLWRHAPWQVRSPMIAMAAFVNSAFRWRMAVIRAA